MTYSPSNSLGPFIPTSTFFPDEFSSFREKFLDLYRQLSNSINTREVGIFDLNQNPTGQSWFTLGDPQTKRFAFRKAFTFTAAGNIAHGLSGLTQVMGYGEYTDGTNFYGVIYASSVAIAGQVTFYVTPTNIVVIADAAAPAITSGVIVLEYLLN